MNLAEIDRSLEATLTTVWLAVWRHKVVFVLVTAAVFVPIIAGMLRMQPIYEAGTLMIGGQSSLEQRPGGRSRPAETPIALSRIAESEEVVTKAIQKIGLDNLVDRSRPGRTSIIVALRRIAFPSLVVEPTRYISPLEVLLPVISRSLGVRAEPNSDILRITFRHPDPVVAADFANAVAQALVDRQIQLYSSPGVVDFFMRQQERFEAEFRRASDELETFSARTAIYSTVEQRQLLLKRVNDLSSAMAVTRGSISEKTGERQALGDTLRKLIPVARSPYVSSLVDSLAGERGVPRPGDRTLDDRTSDPPLLLVRVYQDSMQALFKANSDLAGAQNLLQQQAVELAKLMSELNTLSENEQQFTVLKRAVDQASLNLDVYSKRMIEEQINAESNTARFSSVKVLQKAILPLRPVSPNYVLIIGVAAVGSVVLGVLASLLQQSSARSRRR